MNSIYLIILALLLYTFFGMIVETLLPPNTSSRLLSIKIRIFFYTYAAPVIFLTSCIFFMFNNSRPLKIAFCALLTLSYVIQLISTRRRYLTAFQIIDNTLAISYLTQFFKPQVLQLHLTDITDYEMTKANWLIRNPHAVNFKSQDEWTTYEIIDKTLKAEVKRRLAAIEVRDGFLVSVDKIDPLT